MIFFFFLHRIYTNLTSSDVIDVWFTEASSIYLDKVSLSIKGKQNLRSIFTSKKKSLYLLLAEVTFVCYSTLGGIFFCVTSEETIKYQSTILYRAQLNFCICIENNNNKINLQQQLHLHYKFIAFLIWNNTGWCKMNGIANSCCITLYNNVCKI